jgi:hypothetical protein
MNDPWRKTTWFPAAHGLSGRFATLRLRLKESVEQNIEFGHGHAGHARVNDGFSEQTLVADHQDPPVP